MGCGKICKAKKAARSAQRDADAANADAQKQAAAARKQASAAQASASNSALNLKVVSYSLEVITVGKFLGVDSKQNALSIREMLTLLAIAKNSPQIASSAVAKNLIAPIAASMNAYKVLDYGRKAFLVVKPGIKIAMQINDIVTFNFAALGELISDVAQFILQILIGFAPLLIEILKNIFLDIPLYTNLLTSEQSFIIEGLVTISQLNIKDRISVAITEYQPSIPYCSSRYSQKHPEILPSSQAIKAISEEMNTNIQTYVQHDPFPTLESLTDVAVLTGHATDYMRIGLDSNRKDVLKNVIDASLEEEINILEIPDVSTSSVDDKKAMKDMMNGFVTIAQKTESAIAEELLRRQFVPSQLTPTKESERFADVLLAETMAENFIESLRNQLRSMLTGFNLTNGSLYPQFNLCSIMTLELNSETNKRLERIESDRQDIVTVTVAEELIQSNKIQIFDNIIKSLINVGFNPDDVTLNDCMSIGSNDDFNTLKSNTIDANFTKVDDDVSVVDTATMLALRDEIYSDTVAAINDELIVPDGTCGFDADVCRALNEFKSGLVLEIERNMKQTSINVAVTDAPDYVDKYKLTQMVDRFNSSIIEELMIVVRAIILDSVLPCKACKPCEDMKDDLYAYAVARIEEIKDEMIRNAEVYIMDETLNWTISNGGDIVIKKQQLIDVQNTALSTNAGIVDMFDVFIYRLKLEEKEIIKNITSTIKNS